MPLQDANSAMSVKIDLRDWRIENREQTTVFGVAHTTFQLYRREGNAFFPVGAGSVRGHRVSDFACLRAWLKPEVA